MRGLQLISNKLQYFIELYRQGSYAKASRAISISYQGLKRSIESLESELGTELFTVEDGGALAPTEFAKLLYDTLRRWSHDECELASALSALKRGGQRYLPLYAVAGGLYRPRKQPITKFEQAHPHIALEIIECPDETIDEMLEDGFIDYAVVASPFPEGVVVEPLYSSTNCVWVNRKHSLASRSELTMADLADQDIMIPNPRLKTYDDFDQAFSSRKIKPRSVSYCADLLAPFLFALNNSGLGIGVLDVGEQLKGVEEVACIPLVDGHSYMFGLAIRVGYEPDVDEQALFDFIVARYSNRL